MSTPEEREKEYIESLNNAKYYFDRIQWLLHEYADYLGAARTRDILKKVRTNMNPSNIDILNGYSIDNMETLFYELNEEILLKKAEGKIGRTR